MVGAKKPKAISILGEMPHFRGQNNSQIACGEVPQAGFFFSLLFL
jgi:hypothetical protein